MKVLVLAAGYGTRLKQIAKDIPKPLLQVQGKALIEYILDEVVPLKGLTEVLVVTNDKFFHVFEGWAQSLSDFPVPIKVVNDGTKTPEDRLGSVGDINYVLDQSLVNDDLLVVGGDNLFDFDLAPYQEFALKRSPNVTIGIYDIKVLEECSKFGVVETAEDGKIVSFEEKPQKPKSTTVAMCFYYFPKSSLNLVGKYLSQTEKSDKAGDYIKWLCTQGDVYGYQFEGSWYDIGSIESFKEAQEKF